MPQVTEVGVAGLHVRFWAGLWVVADEELVEEMRVEWYVIQNGVSRHYERNEKCTRTQLMCIQL